jgi:hypothetical protein
MQQQEEARLIHAAQLAQMTEEVPTEQTVQLQTGDRILLTDLNEVTAD